MINIIQGSSKGVNSYFNRVSLAHAVECLAGELECQTGRTLEAAFAQYDILKWLDDKP